MKIGMPTFLITFVLLLCINLNVWANNCLHFDGVDDEVLISPFPVPLSNNLTVELWFYNDIQDDPTTSCQWNRLFDLSGLFAVHECDGMLAVNGSLTSAPPINDGKWHHLALVASYNLNFYDLYLDGILVYSGPYIVLASTLNLGDGNWRGQMDDLRIWSALRSANEIQSEKNCRLTGTEPNLEAYYAFNQGIPGGDNSTLTVLTDDTGNGHDGTLSNFTLLYSHSNFIMSDAPVCQSCVANPVPNSTVTIKKEALIGNTPITSLKNGQEFTYKIIFSINATLEDKLEIIDYLPAHIELVGFPGFVALPGASFPFTALTPEYDPGNHTLKFTRDAPGASTIPISNSVEISFRAKYKNGVRPCNACHNCNRVEIYGYDGANTFFNEDELCLNVDYGPSNYGSLSTNCEVEENKEVLYKMQIVSPGYPDYIEDLSMLNQLLKVTVPAGAVVTAAWWQLGSGSAFANLNIYLNPTTGQYEIQPPSGYEDFIINSNPSTFPFEFKYFFTVSHTVPAGSSLDVSADLCYMDNCGALYTISGSSTNTVQPASTGGAQSLTANLAYDNFWTNVCCANNFNFTFETDEPLDRVVIINMVPEEIRPYQLYISAPPGSTWSFQTIDALSNTQTFSGSYWWGAGYPMTAQAICADPQNVSANVKFVEVRYIIEHVLPCSPITVGYEFYINPERVPSNNPQMNLGYTFQNCATAEIYPIWTGIETPTLLGPDCDDVTIAEGDPVRLNDRPLQKSIISHPEPYQPGECITFRLNASNFGSKNLPDVDITDYLDPCYVSVQNMRYQLVEGGYRLAMPSPTPGNWIPLQDAVLTPDPKLLSITPIYDPGPNTLTFNLDQFPGTCRGERIYIEYDACLSFDCAAGSCVENYFNISSPDLDFLNDHPSGVTPVTTNTGKNHQKINIVEPTTVLDIEKTLTNLLYPGAWANYNITVNNNSTSTVRDIVVVDVLPDPGDFMPLTGASRGSTGSANIAAPLNYLLPMYVDYWNMDLTGVPVPNFNNNDLCNGPAWDIFANSTPVESVKIHLGANEKLYPNGSTSGPSTITFPLKMSIPVGTPVGTIICNNLVYQATLDASGILLLPAQSEVVCDTVQECTGCVMEGWVWNDLDIDGQQGVEAGFNGLIIELYEASGAFVAATVSADDWATNPGFYKFCGLDSNTDYYLQVVAPSGKNITNADVGNDNTDSDVNPFTLKSALIQMDECYANLDIGVTEGFPCGCEGYSNFLVENQTAGTPPAFNQCGGTINGDCNDKFLVSITQNCFGTNCPPQISWDLIETTTGNSVDCGAMTSATLGLSLDFAAYGSTAGIYELVITSDCGPSSCDACVLYFNLDCEACECLPGIIEFTDTAGNTVSASCNSSVTLPDCDNPFFINPSGFCPKDDICIAEYAWVLTSAAGTMSGTNFFTPIVFDPAFSPYFFEYYSTCGTVECPPCFVTIYVDECMTTPPCDSIPVSKTFSTTLVPGDVNHIDLASEGIINSNGEYIILGLKEKGTPGTLLQNLVFTKLDPQGNLIIPPKELIFNLFTEVFIFSNTSLLGIEMIEVFTAGGIPDGYAGTATFVDANPQKKVMVFRLDTNGDVLWAKHINNDSNFNRYARGIHHDAATNNYWIVTQNAEGGSGFDALEVFKLSGSQCNGSYSYSLPGGSLKVSASTAISGMPNSNAAFAVTGNGGNDANQVYFIVFDQNFQAITPFMLYDLDGVSNTLEQPFDIKQDGDFLVITGSRAEDTGQKAFFLKIKPFNNSGGFLGTIVNAKDYDIPDLVNPGNEKDTPYSIDVTASSQYVMTGSSDQTGGMLKSFLLKTENDGTPAWLNHYTEDSYDYSIAFNVETASDGGFFMVGEQYTFGGSAPNVKIWAAKTDESGILADCDCYQPGEVIVSTLQPDTVSYFSQQIFRECISNTPEYASNALESNQIFCDQFCPPIVCEALFIYTPGNCGQVSFTDQSSGVVSYSWDFGEPASGTNNTSTLPNPTHTFSSCNTFNVCLTITCEDGSTDTYCDNIVITDNVAPQAFCIPGIIVQLDALGQAQIAPADIDNGSFDDCGPVTLSLDKTNFDCDDMLFSPVPVALTVTDWCGNTSACQSFVTVQDNQVPLLTCPPDVVLDCADLTDPIDSGQPEIMDNCPNNLIITFEDITISGPCPLIIERTWTVTDWLSGYTTFCVQQITIDDTEKPVITCPAGITIDCNADPDDLNIVGTATAIDNCTLDPILDNHDSVTIGDPCDIIIQRLWTATDDCGNTTSCTQTIHLVDNTPPVLVSCPPDVTVQGMVLPPLGCTGIANVSLPSTIDDCNPNITFSWSLSGATSGNGNGSMNQNLNVGITTIVWTATDGCDNATVLCSSLVTVLPCDGCCGSFEAFCEIVDPVWDNLTVSCDTLCFTPPITDCNITWCFNWGDGTPQECWDGSLTGICHDYDVSEPETFYACMTALEFNSDGFICNEKVVCDSILISPCGGPCIDIIELVQKEVNCEVDCLEDPFCLPWLRNTIQSSISNGCQALFDYYQFEKAYWGTIPVFIGRKAGAPDGGSEDVYDCNGNLIQSCVSGIGIICNPDAGINLFNDLNNVSLIWSCPNVLPPLDPNCVQSGATYDYCITVQNNSNPPHTADDLWINQVGGLPITIIPNPIPFPGGLNSGDIATVNFTIHAGSALPGETIKLEIGLSEGLPPLWDCFSLDTLCIVLPPCDSCCIDEEVFVANAESAITIDVNNDLCKATVQIGTLSDCDEIVTIQWGDSSVDPGAFPSGSMPMHTYSGSGVYTILVTFYEYDENGEICFTHVVQRIINLNCESCECGPWEIFLNHGGITYNPVCGQMPPIELGCPYGDITISGVFGCVTSLLPECPASQVTWTLTGPAGTSSGTTQPGAINIFLPEIMVNNPGNYQLILESFCQGVMEPCVCVIEWVQQDCVNGCCQPFEAFCEIVDPVWDNSTVSCDTLCFTPQLSDCTLSWCIDWGDGTVECWDESVPDFCHDYNLSDPATFLVCMEVIEYDEMGDTCNIKTYCQELFLEPCGGCEPIIQCPNDTIIDCCGNFELPEIIVIDSCGLDNIICIRDDGLDLGDPFGPGTTCITCIIEYDPTNNGEQKVLSSDGASGDRFGSAVSVSGDYAIIGADSDDDSGSAYIFKHDGTSWQEQAKLTASDGDIDDSFGNSASISGDYAVVGAYKEEDNGYLSGSAYIFNRSGTTWTEQAKITASDGDLEDRFGISVAISGDYAIIGAYFDDDNGSDSGSAYIFHRTGTTWTEEAKITASDAAGGDQFGSSVTIWGDYVLVGAPKDDDHGSSSGSVYVFKRTGTTWTEQAKLTASDATVGDWFGRSVSLSGDDAVIGAAFKDDGVFAAGAAYIFQRNGTSWTEQAKMKGQNPLMEDYFGQSVSISGDCVVIGAYRRYFNLMGSGAAYVYLRSGSSWALQSNIIPSDAAAGDFFGSSVSTSGDVAIIGAHYNNDNGPGSGSAYFYELKNEPLYDTCTYCITVLDTTPPTISCPDTITLMAGDTCEVLLPDYTGLVTVTDSCSAPTVCVDISAGIPNTSFLALSDGSLYSWGWNTHNQLGLGNTIDQWTPQLSGSISGAVSVSGGKQHAAAVKADGTLWSWGNGSNGRLGTGNTNNQPTPVQVGTDTDWNRVISGSGFGFGIKNDGRLFAWGQNATGILGLGNNNDQWTPVQVMPGSTWIDLFVSNDVLGIQSDGTLWLFDNVSNLPVQVGTDNDWKQASVSFSDSYFAVKNNGTLWSWGDNSVAQLGLGATGNLSEPSPVQIGTDTDWACVEGSGSDFIYGVKTNGTLWGWGPAGLLGNGNVGGGVTYFTPTQIGSDNKWTCCISAGGAHTIASKTDGSVWSWGAGYNGCLGTNSTNFEFDPVQIFPPSTSSGGNVTVTQKPDPGTILLPGMHEITICASDGCWNLDSCTFVLNVVCDPTCCSPFEEFCEVVDPVWDNLNVNCDTLCFTPPTTDCTITWCFDWGDGTPQQCWDGSLTGICHDYGLSEPETFYVCMTALEFDDNGFICNEKVVCDSILVSPCGGPCLDVIELVQKEVDCQGDCFEDPFCLPWLRATIQTSLSNGCQPLFDYYQFEKAYWGTIPVLIGRKSGAPDGGSVDIYDCNGTLIQSCTAGVGVSCNPDAGINVSLDLSSVSLIWSCPNALPPLDPNCTQSGATYDYCITVQNTSNPPHTADDLWINQVGGIPVTIIPNPIPFPGGLAFGDIQTVNFTIQAGSALPGETIKLEVGLSEGLPPLWQCFSLDTLCIVLPPCDSCCVDEMAFVANAENAITVSVNNDLCKATVAVGTLLECDEVTQIEWGDGTIDPGPFPSGVMPMHTYANSGTYLIKVTVVEFDDNMVPCFTHEIQRTITLECESCECGPWEFELSHGGIVYNPVCGQLPPIVLGCPYSDVVISGTFGCLSPGFTECPASQVSWTLNTPTSTLSGTTLPGAINITFPVTDVDSPGNYELILQSACQGVMENCECVIEWVQQGCDVECCYNYEELCAIAEPVFTNYYIGCNELCFFPVQDSCIIWCVDWGDGSAQQCWDEMSNRICHDYNLTETETFVVCMTAKEYDDDGNLCQEKIFCEEITIEACDPCCQEPEDVFIANAESAVTVAYDEDLCKVTVAIDGLSDCRRVNYIKWGDGTIINGPYGNGNMFMHTYTTNGVYTIEVLITELDEDGHVCYAHTVIRTIDLDCLCACEGWQWLSLGFPGKPFVEVPVDCNDMDPVPFECPGKINHFYFHGNFTCTDTCGMGVEWEIIPLGSTVPESSGTVSGWYLGGNSYHFDINNIPYPTTGGLYELVIKAHCGSHVCECRILFEMPDCGPDCECEEPILPPKPAAVMSAIHISGCNNALLPVIDLDEECDVVKWRYLNNTIAGVPIGTSMGNDPINFTFPGNGIYSICMEVTRTLPDGTTCPPEERCQRVKIHCGLPTIACDYPIIVNPGFVEGAVPGILGNGGASDGWAAVFGTPEILEGPGCPDDFTVKLTGNKLDADGLSTIVELNGAEVYSLSFCASLEEGWAHPGSQVVFRISGEQQAGLVCEGDCAEVARVDIVSDGYPSAFTINTDFVVPAMLNEGSKYLTIHVENGSEFPDLKTVAYLDAFCIESDSVVAIKEPLFLNEVNLYPNPTSGNLTLEFSEPIPEDVNIYILDVMGRMLDLQEIVKGSSLHHLEVSGLPSAVYFIKINDKKGRAWYKKFVKQ